MPLINPVGGDKTAKDAAEEKAKETFEALNKKFENLPSTSETISFRVPKGERLRLKNLFARHGLKMSEACKTAVYKYAKELDG